MKHLKNKEAKIPKVGVRMHEVIQETEITEETKAIIEDAAVAWDLPEVWFLFETVQKFGVLTEKNILSFILWYEEVD